MLKGLEIDVNPMIDAITILAVVACFATSPTRLDNGKIARSKECDRIAAITSELKKMGARIAEHDDGMTIYPSTVHGANFNAYNDHRMADVLECGCLSRSRPISYYSHPIIR